MIRRVKAASVRVGRTNAPVGEPSTTLRRGQIGEFHRATRMWEHAHDDPRAQELRRARRERLQAARDAARAAYRKDMEEYL